MKCWLYRHRGAVKTAYCLVAITVILILQILEAHGAVP